MCVILSAKISNVEDPSLADKEAVLASLNIKVVFNTLRVLYVRENQGSCLYIVFTYKHPYDIRVTLGS